MNTNPGGGQQGQRSTLPETLLLTSETPTAEPAPPECGDPDVGVIMPTKPYGQGVWLFDLTLIPEILNGVMGAPLRPFRRPRGACP